MISLTPRARELYAFIESQSLCPSMEEMADALGIKGKSGILCTLNQLEERGYIRRLRYRVRAIEIIAPMPSKMALPPPPPMPLGPADPVYLKLASGRINFDNHLNWPNRLEGRV